jgi:hypothetical protein
MTWNMAVRTSPNSRLRNSPLIKVERALQKSRSGNMAVHRYVQLADLQTPAVRRFVKKRDGNIQFIAEQPLGEQPQPALDRWPLAYRQSGAELVMDAGMKDRPIAEQSLQDIGGKRRIEIVGCFGGSLRNDLGDFLKRPALNGAFPARIIDEIETAGEETEQDRDHDRIAGLPEGKAIK